MARQFLLPQLIITSPRCHNILQWWFIWKLYIELLPGLFWDSTYSIVALVSFPLFNDLYAQLIVFGVVWGMSFVHWNRFKHTQRTLELQFRTSQSMLLHIMECYECLFPLTNIWNSYFDFVCVTWENFSFNIHAFLFLKRIPRMLYIFDQFYETETVGGYIQIYQFLNRKYMIFYKEKTNRIFGDIAPWR